VHADAGRERVRAFAANDFALARGERRQERIESAIAGILPMELLMGALEEAALAQQFPFRRGGEGDVDRGRVRAPADVDQRVGEGGPNGLRLRPRARQQPAAGRGRERHGHLELWIVAAASALIGFGPAVIEDVFAARMGFHVAGDGAEKPTFGVFSQHMHRLPAGARTDRLRYFESGKKIIRNEWVISIS
jgi:hypothetical protein